MTEAVSNKLKYFSFVFSFFIVLYHANLVYVGHYPLPELIKGSSLQLFDIMAALSLSYFFTASGFLLYRNANRTNALDKIKSRFVSLMIPFFVWNIIYFIKELLTEGHSLLSKDISQLLYDFFFAPYDGPLWYVFAIFLLSLSVWPICTIKNNRILIYAISISLVILSVIISGFNIIAWPEYLLNAHFETWIKRLFRYLPCYITGSLIGMYKPQSICYHPTSRVQSFSFYILIPLIVLYALLPDTFRFIKPVLLPFLVIMIWICQRLPYHKINPHIISGSFLIYASHMVVIVIVFHIVKSFYYTLPQTNLTFLLCWIFFLIAVIIAVCLFRCIIVFIIDKFKLKILNTLLTGNRL